MILEESSTFFLYMRIVWNRRLESCYGTNRNHRGVTYKWKNV